MGQQPYPIINLALKRLSKVSIELYVRQKFSDTEEFQSKHCEGWRITFSQRVKNGFVKEDAFEMFFGGREEFL